MVPTGPDTVMRFDPLPEPYFVEYPGGVLVWNYAPWPYGDLVKLINGGRDNTMTASSSLIISSLNASDNPTLIRHELGHVEQAKEMGLLYMPTYVVQWLLACAHYGLDDAHKYHPMEVDANARAGLPLYWGD